MADIISLRVPRWCNRDEGKGTPKAAQSATVQLAESSDCQKMYCFAESTGCCMQDKNYESGLRRGRNRDSLDVLVAKFVKFFL
jgi:hypothetical protein